MTVALRRRARLGSALAAALVLTAASACTRPVSPSPTTRPTTAPATARPPTTEAAGHGDHGHDPADGPYTSVDDPRLTPDQRARAKDLVARTQRAVAGRFTDVASVTRAGYVSIRDSDSGYEHFIKHPFLSDGRTLDADHIESFVFETKPGQPKRLVAAMYILDNGKTMADVPDVAGPLTPWHNHEDLCWDPTMTYVQGVYRLGRCIPAGTVKQMNPMLHVWLVPNQCGPFAEVDDMNGLVDRYLRSVGLIPPAPTGCAHVHGGEHS